MPYVSDSARAIAERATDHRRRARSRAEPREVVELKQLQASQPELASAVDMQLALVEMQRRVQARVPLPWIQADRRMAPHAAGGRPADRALRRHPARLDRLSGSRSGRPRTSCAATRRSSRPSTQQIVALGRDGNALEPLVTRWYTATSGVDGGDARDRLPADGAAGLDQVLVLALRPFLARCAEALAQRTDSLHWHHGHCPFCGWEPDFAVITPNADRRLICGRCVAQWAFAPLTCPFCANDDRTLITSFATRDGRYRVYACDVCRRYLKAYDGRQRAAAGDGRGGHDRHAAARRGGDAARVYVAGVEAVKSWLTDAVGLNRREPVAPATPTSAREIADVLLRQPVEEVLRFQEAAGVRARAEHDDRDLLAALRQPQQRREAVAGLRDEAGLARPDVDIVASEQMVRAAERDRARLGVGRPHRVLGHPHDRRDALVAATRSVMSRAMSYADETLSDSRPDGSA